jgi:hypothetical protein
MVLLTSMSPPIGVRGEMIMLCGMQRLVVSPRDDQSEAVEPSGAGAGYAANGVAAWWDERVSVNVS